MSIGGRSLPVRIWKCFSTALGPNAVLSKRELFRDAGSINDENTLLLLHSLFVICLPTSPHFSKKVKFSSPLNVEEDYFYFLTITVKLTDA